MMTKTSKGVAVCGAALVLVACGGGSGGTPEPAVDTPPAPLAALAGRYTLVTGSATGEVDVLADGHANGYVRSTVPIDFIPGSLITQNTFAGTFSSAGTQASASGVPFNYASNSAKIPATPTGKADISLAPGTPGLAVNVTNSNGLSAFTWPATFTKQPTPAVFAGLPFSKLTGHYFDGESIPPTGQDFQISSSGAVSGLYGFDCNVTGTLATFDSQTAVFRMEATFTGSGCGLLGTQPGSGQIMGTLASSRFGHVVLVGFGIVGDRPASVRFMHSQVLGTY